MKNNFFNKILLGTLILTLPFGVSAEYIEKDTIKLTNKDKESIVIVSSEEALKKDKLNVKPNTIKVPSNLSSIDAYINKLEGFQAFNYKGLKKEIKERKKYHTVLLNLYREDIKNEDLLSRISKNGEYLSLLYKIKEQYKKI